MKKTKVTLLKGYHGSDGYMHPGQSLEVDSDHAKQLALDGFIEKEEKSSSSRSTKDDKGANTGETK